MASGVAALADGCEECPRGQYSAGFPAPGAAECVACPPGRFLYDPPLTGVALELSLQQPHAPRDECRVGLWSDVVGAHGSSSETACKGCPAGKYSRQAVAGSADSCEIRNEMVKTNTAQKATPLVVAILPLVCGVLVSVATV